MEEKKLTPEEQEQNNPLLTEPVIVEEILPDEMAMSEAGLTHPGDMEVNRLLSAARESIGDEELVSETQQGELFHDQEYTDTFGGGEELARVFSDEAYPALEENPVEQPVYESPNETEHITLRKGRPKRKKGYGLFGLPHILATVIWLMIVLAIGVSLGRVIWVCAADVLAFGREEMEVTVSIDDTDTIEDIALTLQRKGLIRYPGLFKLYAQLSDAREDISSGTFTLNTIYDYHALVNSMSYYSSSRKEVTVMIPEGYNCAQIFALLEENKVCTVAELEEYAANGELDEYWFLEGVERGEKNCLEGFLFPDTYDFYVNDDPESVLEKLLDTFDYRFSDEMTESIAVLNEHLAEMMRSHGYDDAYIADNLFTIREVVIVASLIEKETSGSLESPTIASVIYNRLTNQASYPYLDIDATLLYVLGYREELTAEDLQTDSPYNTRTSRGLIPGPIANPGLNSLKAALNPENTDYHYYALNPDTGSHHFSRTYDEHMNFLSTVEY